MSYYDKICLINTVLIFPLILIAYFNTAFRPRANKYQPGANTDKFTSGFNPSCILDRPKMSSGSEKVIAEIPVNEGGILCLSGQEAKVILENVSKRFFSETTWIIETKLPRNDHWKVLYKVCFLCRSKIQDGRHHNTQINIGPYGKMFKCLLLRNYKYY